MERVVLTEIFTFFRKKNLTNTAGIRVKMSYNFLCLLTKILRQCLLIALFILATLLNKIGPFFVALARLMKFFLDNPK